MGGWLFATAALSIFAFALFKYPRPTLYVLGGLIGIGAAGWFYFTILETHKKQKEAKVQVTAAYDLDHCKSQYFPIRVIILNNSESTVTKTEWRLEAFAPSRSSNLVKYAYLSSDRILKPHQTITLCYQVPDLSEKVDPATLEWSAVRDDVVFSDAKK